MSTYGQYEVNKKIFGILEHNFTKRTKVFNIQSKSEKRRGKVKFGLGVTPPSSVISFEDFPKSDRSAFFILKKMSACVAQLVFFFDINFI